MSFLFTSSDSFSTSNSLLVIPASVLEEASTTLREAKSVQSEAITVRWEATTARKEATTARWEATTALTEPISSLTKKKESQILFHGSFYTYFNFSFESNHLFCFNGFTGSTGKILFQFIVNGFCSGQVYRSGLLYTSIIVQSG